MKKKNIIKGLVITLIVSLGFIFSSSFVFAHNSNWLDPSSYSNSDVTNAELAYTQDGEYVYFDSSKSRVYYNFGDSIVPDEAIIEGIEVRLDAYKDSSPTLDGFSESSPIDTLGVQLYTSWRTMVGFKDTKLLVSDTVKIGTMKNTGILPDTDTNNYIVLGSASDKWDYEDLTAANVNSLKIKVTFSRDSSIGDYLDHIQLRVTYTMPSYNIDYNLNGGANNPDNPLTYDILGDDIVLEAPTRTGFTFGGWYDNSELTGTAITTLAKENEVDYTLYAKWVEVPILPQTGQYGILIGALITITLAGVGMIAIKKNKSKS